EHLRLDRNNPCSPPQFVPLSVEREILEFVDHRAVSSSEPEGRETSGINQAYLKAIEPRQRHPLSDSGCSTPYPARAKPLLGLRYEATRRSPRPCLSWCHVANPIACATGHQNSSGRCVLDNGASRRLASASGPHRELAAAGTCRRQEHLLRASFR